MNSEIKGRLGAYLEIYNKFPWSLSSTGEDWRDILIIDLIIPYLKTTHNMFDNITKHMPSMADIIFDRLYDEYYNGNNTLILEMLPKINKYYKLNLIEKELGNINWFKICQMKN